MDGGGPQLVGVEGVAEPGVQVPVDGVSGVLGLLNSGPLSSSADRSCTQNPTETNTSTTTTGDTITNG